MSKIKSSLLLSSKVALILLEITIRMLFCSMQVLSVDKIPENKIFWDCMNFFFLPRFSKF